MDEHETDLDGMRVHYICLACEEDSKQSGWWRGCHHSVRSRPSLFHKADYSHDPGPFKTIKCEPSRQLSTQYLPLFFLHVALFSYRALFWSSVCSLQFVPHSISHRRVCFLTFINFALVIAVAWGSIWCGLLGGPRRDQRRGARHTEAWQTLGEGAQHSHTQNGSLKSI